MKILEVVTEHTAPFKILFEVLKDMLTESNLVFVSNKKTQSSDTDDGETDGDNSDKKKHEEKDCMKMIAIDPTKSVLINLKLDGDSFSKFVCKKSKLVLGINLAGFYKVIKSMAKNDILTFSVDHEKKNYLQIKIDNQDTKKDTEFNLKLLDLDESKMSIPEIAFDAVITMNSQEFNKLCREMHGIADYVEIKCLSDRIIFACVGEIADRKTTYRTRKENEEDNNNILVTISHASLSNKNAPEIVQGVFELKNLVLFSKCTSLCNDIEIYMKNSFPLVIKYTVATLGRILLCLTPIGQEKSGEEEAKDSDADEPDDSDDDS